MIQYLRALLNGTVKKKPAYIFEVQISKEQWDFFRTDAVKKHLIIRFKNDKGALVDDLWCKLLGFSGKK